MSHLYTAILIIFSFSLLLNYLSNYSNKNSIETVNDMGIGYNLGKTFNYFNSSENNYTQNYQIKIWGTVLPTKKMIHRIKNYGFKTIRLQVISIYSSNVEGRVSSEWISRIKEIVDWIINYNMYCILSVYYEGKYWRIKKIREKYINFWKQIAKEFINFNENLIFETFNGIDYGFIYEDIYENKNTNNKSEEYYYDYENYYMNLFNSTQAFIYTIRNFGGYNLNRLLIISELSTEIEIIFNSYFLKSQNPKIPIDPSNKLAISLNYYFPSEIHLDYDKIQMDWYNRYQFTYSTNPMSYWGTYKDYQELMKNFDFLKKNYINKGIPVIIGEVGINIEKNKEINWIKEFLYVIFSISSDINGIMSCLWDISEKIEENVSYYNKEKNYWSDIKIKHNFVKISKGKYISSLNFYNYTNIEKVTLSIYDYFIIELGKKKVSKIIINAKILCKLHIDCEFIINTYDKNGEILNILIKDNGKRQYDGTIIFTIDAHYIDCNQYIEAYKYLENGKIIINNMSIEFEENFKIFDYIRYKSAVLKEIN